MFRAKNVQTPDHGLNERCDEQWFREVFPASPSGGETGLSCQDSENGQWSGVKGRSENGDGIADGESYGRPDQPDEKRDHEDDKRSRLPSESTRDRRW